MTSEEKRAAVFAALWRDAKYVKLNERKDAVGAAWNRADAYGKPEAASLLKRFKAACKRVNEYENAALLKEGFKW